LSLPFGGPPATAGTVHLVGGGPGDPGLVGLRAAQLLSTATFVAYDRLAPPEALALCPEDCTKVYVGKLPDRHALSQPEINDLLVARAREGDAVVRFKGGDPFVLGRGSEEAQACVAAGVPFEVVPAVTAGVAAPAYAGIPVTHRGLSPAFAVVTGHEDPTKVATQVDYAALAAFPGTLLFYMGVGRVAEIAAALVAQGKPGSTPVALVRWGSTPRQETLTGTLQDIGGRVEEARFANPAIIVVGDVVALRDEIAWYDRRPLHGVSVLVPRTRHQASELSSRLRALGADPVEAPTIAIEPARDPAALRAALRAVTEGAFDWVAFTSANGVDGAWEQLEEIDADARLFAAVRIACVGPGTAGALARRGLRADLVPETYTTRGLAQALAGSGPPARILLPRADIATPVLAESLTGAGWAVTDVEAYRTVRAAALPDDVRGRLADIDVVALASSSTARNLAGLLEAPLPEGMRVVSIGPVTSATCAELGWAVAAEASPHDVDGLVAAVLTAARGS
jgi:uroporphyrinogen III methyltransferase / synthase